MSSPLYYSASASIEVFADNIGIPPSSPTPWPAYLSLHLATLLPLQSGRGISLVSLQQIRKSDQILVAEKASTGRDLHEHIDPAGIGTVGQNRLQMAFSVAEVNSVLTPVRAVFDQLKLAAE
jgi:hypothetical protein